MSLIDMRLGVAPGDGLVQRAGETVLIVLGATGGEDGLRQLLDVCRTRSGAELARALAAEVLGGKAESMPAFAVLTESGNGLIAICRGDIEVCADSAGAATRVSGRGVVTWVEQALGHAVERVLVGPPGGVADRTAPWSDLRSGVVPGGGITLTPIGAPFRPAAPPPLAAAEPPPPAPAPPPDPVQAIGAPPTPPAGLTPAETGPLGAAGGDGEARASEEPWSPERPFEAIPVRDAPVDFSDRVPLPVHSHADDLATPAPEAGFSPAIVMGVRCSRDHHNSPEALYCSSCGIRMGAHRTLNLVEGPRPPLGVLVFDDGSTIPVRHEMIVGREPAVDELAQSGQAMPIRIEDDSSSVSRAHLHVILDGWDVLVADRGSSNGTSVKFGKDGEWRTLQPAERVRLVTGSEVRVGERRFIFDQHHVQ